MSRTERFLATSRGMGLLLAVAWAQVACGAPSGDLAAREAEQRRALDAAIGTPRCEIDAQCWAVPVGARPCGGPESYLPASRLTSDAAKVRQAARALADTLSAQHQASGRMGICSVLPEPAARCDGDRRRCVLGASDPQ